MILSENGAPVYLAVFVLCAQESFFNSTCTLPPSCLGSTGALNHTHASQAPAEPAPAAPPPLITHDEQPSSTELSLKSQWTPLPLPLAAAGWISFSAGLSLLVRFHVKAQPVRLMEPGFVFPSSCTV